jgi:transposase
MTTWETLTMSRKEAPRAGLVKAALAGHITTAQGAQALGLSARQFRRLKARYRVDGVHGLLHRLRGRPSSRALEIEVRDRVGELLQTLYRDVNDCHVTEKLREVEALAVSRSSVRRIRRALGLPPKRRRRARQHRARRCAAPQFGALVQLDGSPHAWFGAHEPVRMLLGAIDDATGRIVALHFRPTEDLHGYLTLLRLLAAAAGLPLALYGDRLNVFIRTDRHWSLEEQLQGERHPTHFGQVLRDLGIGYIAAHSPQAKGRIERLWETLQDRLVVELRLRGLTTPEAAQAYLPEFIADYNRRFAHPPANRRPAWRPPPRDFAELLSCRYQRVVARDHTVRVAGRCLDIPPGPHRRAYAGARVEVRECLDGRLLAFYQGQPIATQPAPAPDFVLIPRHTTRGQRLSASQSPSEEGGRHLPPPRNRPAADRARPALPTATRPRPDATHPWRRPFTRRGRQMPRTPEPGRTFSRTS